MDKNNPRRKFLKQLGMVSFAAMPISAIAKHERIEKIHSPLPAPSPENEQYWELVKKKFMVPKNLIMVNAANLCPSPGTIVEQVNNYTKEFLGKNVSFQYRTVFADARALSLKMLAEFLGVSKSEIGITRNTSESNTIVINSLDLKAGDEVVIWDQNHPSARITLEQRATRYGFTVKKLSLPISPSSPTELIDLFSKSITSKTKLLAFSHISNVSGMALPAKELCAIAKQKNVLTLVDGAQSFGSMDLNLKEMGCDFYTASTHKWLMGPLENGILYMKQEHLEKIWPNVIGGGWHDGTSTVDEKICVLGQRNEASPVAIPSIIEFHHSIGKSNISKRVIQLNSYLKDEIRKKIPAAEFITPLSPNLSAGIVIVILPGKDPAIVYQDLYAKYGIAAANVGGIRLSPHIYNTLEDIDKIADALKALSA